MIEIFVNQCPTVLFLKEALHKKRKHTKSSKVMENINVCTYFFFLQYVSQQCTTIIKSETDRCEESIINIQEFVALLL